MVFKKLLSKATSKYSSTTYTASFNHLFPTIHHETKQSEKKQPDVFDFPWIFFNFVLSKPR